MNKEEVKQILLQNNITVKKKYGQNFLLDESILNNIVLKSNIKENSYIVEIGPGSWFFNQEIKSMC